MNKSELIDEIRSVNGDECSKACAERALDAVLNAIMKGLKRDGSVQLIGFGTFKVSDRKARNGRNPRTGETIKIAASKVPAFSAGQALKDAVNKKKK